MIKTPPITVLSGAFWTPSAMIIGNVDKGKSPDIDTPIKTLDEVIKTLFMSNEQGFAYDPNDLTTLYQDTIGTTPVTEAGQPIGLVLDKSKGLILGYELFVNPKMTGQWVDNGDGSYTCSNSVATSDLSITTGVIGKTYNVSFEVTQNSSSISAFQFSSSRSAITTTGVFKSVRIKTYSKLTFRVGVGQSATIRAITAKEITGNHAYQTTSSMRPLLATSPQRLDYDTVNDKLITNLPDRLTGCTVIRSVPNIGTQILTNKTIPTTYNDNTDHCGLIVIDRALTATETSQITKLFNKAAGV